MTPSLRKGDKIMRRLGKDSMERTAKEAKFQM